MKKIWLRSLVPLYRQSALDLNLKHGQKTNVKKTRQTRVALSGFDPEPSGL